MVYTFLKIQNSFGIIRKTRSGSRLFIPGIPTIMYIYVQYYDRPIYAYTFLSIRAPLRLAPSELGLAGKLAGKQGIDSNRNRFEVVGVVTVIDVVAGPGSLMLLFRLSLSPARDLPPTPAPS